MSHPCLDPRVWLPLLLAGSWFAARARPPAVEPPAPPAVALALPPMHGLPPSSKEQNLELDAEHSSVRFLVTGLRGELLVACPSVQGSLKLLAGGAGGELELRLDLASLVPLHDSTVHGGTGGVDVPHVLGVHRGSEIVYRANLVATTGSDLPGVVQRTFLGTLRFGSRVMQQPMQLWQCSLPGQPLRLQGHGTVAAETYGLPKRRWLALIDEGHAVTLGLDLAWRRRAR